MRAQILHGSCRKGLARARERQGKPLLGGNPTRARMAAIWRKRRRNAFDWSEPLTLAGFPIAL